MDAVLDVEAMKLSNKQALVLFDVMKWSLQIYGEVAGYSNDLRHTIVNEIMNQQDDRPVNLEDK